MPYQSTKKWGHEEGLSCAFRQHRATSHCHLIHGYPLAFEVTFESETLDDRNWVVDFGSLKSVKNWLKHMFDHTYLLAYDDPEFDLIKSLDQKLIDIRYVDSTGCEACAKIVFNYVQDYVFSSVREGVKVVKVQCWEHGGNSASYVGD